MQLSPVTKTITRERMARISGAGNIHSDEEEAKRQGLGGVIAQGGELCGYLVEMLLNALNEDFIRGGEIVVSFIHPVRPQDIIKTRGEIVRNQKEGSKSHYECEIWIENQRGQKVAVGKASGTTG